MIRTCVSWRMRKNVSWPDEALWRRVEKAAAEEGAKEGRTVSVAEWLREAARLRLEREKPRKPVRP